ncbi:hypothetical protein QQF64_013116 [Cirrhinus molitorella]|uniref:Uncharacterized protein n=1 Tax=Cirrhinus molitorella TaxID=172907 RepID=A0ABR3LRU8_9TELE
MKGRGREDGGCRAQSPSAGGSVASKDVRSISSLIGWIAGWGLKSFCRGSVPARRGAQQERQEALRSCCRSRRDKKCVPRLEALAAEGYREVD